MVQRRSGLAEVREAPDVPSGSQVMIAAGPGSRELVRQVKWESTRPARYRGGGNSTMAQVELEAVALY